MSAALVVYDPTQRELEALTPADRWVLEETLEDAQSTLRKFNDDELRRWVEVDGKTQREIAKMVGRSAGRISQRVKRLGLVPHDARGGRRLPTPRQNGDGPEAPAKKRRKREDVDRPAHHYPDVVAEDAHENVRTQTMHWFEQGRVVKDLLAERRSLEPRSEEDRKELQREAAVMERLARRIKEALDA
jgi:hypothetical protein